MTSAQRSRAETAADIAVDAGFLLTLVVCGTRYFDFHPLEGKGSVVLFLALGSGLAYLCSIALRWVPQARRGRGISPAGVAALIAAACWIPLVMLAPSFGWCAVALILRVRPLLRSHLAWALPALMLLALGWGLFRMTEGKDPGLVVGALFAGSVLTWALLMLDAALRRQGQLINELRATRRHLAEAERHAGAAAERERLAGELHDTVVQRTAGALLLLDAESLSPRPVSPELGEARDALRDALRHTRELLHSVSQSQPPGPGLVTALRTEAESAGAEFAVHGPSRALPTAVEHALLRAAQEGLANATRYAQSDLLRVTLTYFDREVGLDVADRGVGFEPDSLSEAAQDAEGGFGLRAMAARLSAVGGRLTIDSAPGRGTMLSALVPAPEEESQAPAVGHQSPVPHTLERP